MTLVAWTVMMTLAFLSLTWARNRFQLSVYYLTLAAFAGGLMVAEEQYMALTQFFARFSMSMFLAGFVAICAGLVLLVRELHRSDIERVFEVTATEPELELELELEAQPAV